MAVESRLLKDSTSFDETADAWALLRGLVDGDGQPTSRFPVIIGMPPDSVDLGGFNIGIIQSGRTIKQALQDLETAVDGRMFAGNNLADLPNKATARTNLGLGSSATWNIGTSGANIPLMNTANTWTGAQAFPSGTAVSGNLYVDGAIGSYSVLYLRANSLPRWALIRELNAETGNNVGSDLRIGRYSDNGTWLDNPISIARNTGVMTLSQPLPITSGGTGATSAATFKVTLGIDQVNNTSDTNKPISTATQNALNNKYDKVGGTINGVVSIVADNQLVVKSAGTSPSVIHRNDGSNYYLLLSDANSGPTTTWNSLRPLMINVSTGVLRSDNGQGFTGGLTNSGAFNTTGSSVFSNNGNIINLVGAAIYNGIYMRNNAGTTVANACTFVDAANSTGAVNAGVQMWTNANGSSSVDFMVQAAGTQADRRFLGLSVRGTVIDAYLPINGRAYPRRADGQDMNYNWSGQSGTPTWVWGGDGTNFYPYNPANFNVAYAGNAGQLNGITGGNQAGYIRRANDAAVNGSWSRQLVLAGDNATNDVFSPPVEIREIGQVGSSNTSSPYAPGIVFHWSNVTASAMKVHSDGSFRFQAQGTTVSYRNVWALEHYATGWFRPQGATGIYWDSYDRGLTVADNGANYGNVNVTGTGLNGWSGYSINTWATFMANGTDVGIHSPSFGDWLLRFDSNRDAYFPRNVQAYSDERLKENIRPINDVTRRRQGMASSAIMYEKDGLTSIGFGAHALEPHIPEVVATGTDSMKTKSVRYADMVAILAVDNQNLADRLEQAENALADVLARLSSAGL